MEDNVKRKQKTVSVYEDTYRYLDSIKTTTLPDVVDMIAKHYALSPEPLVVTPIEKPEFIDTPSDEGRVVFLKRISPTIVRMQSDIVEATGPLDKFLEATKRIHLGQTETQL